jgi:hypothetical protein
MSTRLQTTNQNHLQALRAMYIESIEDFFGGNDFTFTVNFHRMFTIYITDEERDGSYSKQPVVIKSLECGKTLLGQDWVGDDYEIELKFVEDINELAYILDTLVSAGYTVD